MKITPWDFDKTIVENKKRRTRMGPPFRGGNIFVVGLFLVFLPAPEGTFPFQTPMFSSNGIYGIR